MASEEGCGPGNHLAFSFASHFPCIEERFDKPGLQCGVPRPPSVSIIHQKDLELSEAVTVMVTVDCSKWKQVKLSSGKGA